MVAGLEHRRVLLRQRAADRHAAPESLGERHDVGLNAHLLIRPQRARASDAGLHLVEDQQQVALIAPLADATQVVGGRDVDAALPL